MPTYLIHFKANPSAWPSDPAAVVALWEAVMAGANQLLEQGVVEQIGWVNNTEGYALHEADSKAGVLQTVAAFYPLFSQDVMEFTPHTEAVTAIVAGAKAAAGS